MRRAGALIAIVMFVSLTFAQSGGYQEATYLGFKRVANGSNINVVTGDSYAQSAQAYIIQAGKFQYLILKESDARMQSVLPSPFHHEDHFLDNAQPGTALRVRVAGQKIYVQEGSKEHAYAVTSVVPAAADSGTRVTRPETQPLPSSRGTEAPPVSPAGYRPQFDACLRESGSVPARMLECGATEQAYQEGRLNGVYQQLLAAENSQAQQQTRQSERLWMEERDSKCSAETGTGPDHAIDRPACVLEETKNQANRLQGQLDAIQR